MSKKVLSIEVGCSLTRICEMDYKVKQPKIYNYLSIPTPNGVFDDGFITPNRDFSADIKWLLNNNKIKTKQVVFSITSSKIATRDVSLPNVKANQVDTLVKTNLSDYLPIDTQDYEIATMTLGVSKGEDSADKLKAMVMAADKRLIESYRQFAESLGLQMIAVDYSGNSIYQVMRNECKDETEMVIKVEERSSVVMVISNQLLVMQRNIPYGVENAVFTAMRSYAFEANTYDDALDLLKRKTCIRNVLSENTRIIEKEDMFDESESIRIAKQEITESLSALVNNVSRVLDLFNSKNSDNPITKVSLIGLGSDVNGLSKLFTNELGVKTSVVQSIKGLNLSKSSGEGSVGRFITCIGAGIAPVGFIAEEKAVSTDIKSVNSSFVTVLTVILFLVAIGGLAIYSYGKYNEEVKTEKELKRQEQEYAAAELVYQQYNNLMVFYTQVAAAYESSLSPNDNLINFLAELEAKLPAEAEVSEFSSTTDACTITMAVSNVAVETKVTQTLRGFKSVSNVINAETSRRAEEEVQSENEQAVKNAEELRKQAILEGDLAKYLEIEEPEAKYVFSLVCKYKPVTVAGLDE